MWALIHSGRVTQIAAEQFDVHPSLSWVPCQSDTLAGDSFDGASFTHPAAIPPAVPQQVTMMQATLALHARPGSAPGKTMLDDVEAAVAAASDTRIQLAWARATVLDRHGLFVTQMAPVLGLDDASLDALFMTARGISV